MTCDSACCGQHPGRNCHLPTSHVGNHDDGLGHQWLNQPFPQLNTAQQQPVETGNTK